MRSWEIKPGETQFELCELSLSSLVCCTPKWDFLHVSVCLYLLKEKDASWWHYLIIILLCCTTGTVCPVHWNTVKLGYLSPILQKQSIRIPPECKGGLKNHHQRVEPTWVMHCSHYSMSQSAHHIPALGEEEWNEPISQLQWEDDYEGRFNKRGLNF